MMFGIQLLDDGDGSTMASLEHQHLKNPHAILNAVFTMWIQGEGSTCSWERLVFCLRVCKCHALADDIDSVLS